MSSVRDGPLPLSGADRDSIAGKTDGGSYLLDVDFSDRVGIQEAYSSVPPLAEFRRTSLQNGKNGRNRALPAPDLSPGMQVDRPPVPRLLRLSGSKVRSDR